jgi:hypothetical protein
MAFPATCQKEKGFMDTEFILSWAAVLNALAWPVTILIIVIILRGLVWPAVSKGGGFCFRVKDVEISVAPSQISIPPSTSTEDSSQLTKDVQTLPGVKEEILPFDYYFLNHTSFLRKNKQEEFRKLTGVNRDHYDIRVIVDSYYQGALGRIEYVEYILHRAYPEPIQYRRNPEDKFMLKELANGQYVLMAKVFLKDQKVPMLLQRYITLWESGPRLL